MAIWLVKNNLVDTRTHKRTKEELYDACWHSCSDPQENITQYAISEEGLFVLNMLLTLIEDFQQIGEDPLKLLKIMNSKEKKIDKLEAKTKCPKCSDPLTLILKVKDDGFVEKLVRAKLAVTVVGK